MNHVAKIVVIMLIAASFSAEASAVVVEPFSGGYCLLLLDGRNPTEPTEYDFSNDTGRLQLRADGDWQIIYQNTSVFGDPGASKVDIPLIWSSTFTGSVSSVRIFGRNVTDYIDLGNVSTTNRTLEINLGNGGSVLSSGQILADQFTLRNSTIAGDVLGTIRVGSIEDSSGTGLNITGGVSGLVKTLGNVNGTVEILQDVEGSIEIGGQLTGTLDIGGDACDTGDNHIQICHMVGGHFECENMELKDNRVGWMSLGEGLESQPNWESIEHTGTLDIHGTLSGLFHSRSRCGLTMTIDTIDAGPDQHAQLDYGGVWSSGGYTENFSLVVDTFLDGRISSRGPHEGTGMFLGTVDILSDLGAADSSARIITSTRATNPHPIDIGATITIEGSVFPASDGPAIYATGDLDGQVRINGALYNGTGDEIDIDGALTGSAAIAVNWDGENDRSDSADDEWQSGTSVRVGSTGYTGNTPAAHI